MLYPFNELGSYPSRWKSHPLRCRERVGYVSVDFARFVNANRDQESTTAAHQMRSLVRQSPLEPKVSFCPRLRAFGDDREEQFAVADLRADLLVPHIPAAQLALIEEDFNAGRA